MNSIFDYRQIKQNQTLFVFYITKPFRKFGKGNYLSTFKKPIFFQACFKHSFITALEILYKHFNKKYSPRNHLCPSLDKIYLPYLSRYFFFDTDIEKKHYKTIDLIHHLSYDRIKENYYFMVISIGP